MPVALVLPVWFEVMAKLPGAQARVAAELVRRSGLPASRLVELSDGTLGRRVVAVAEFSERDVGELLGVGRQVVREALRSLVKAGLVEHKRGTGNAPSVLCLRRLDWADPSVGVQLIYVPENPQDQRGHNPQEATNSTGIPSKLTTHGAGGNPQNQGVRNPQAGQGSRATNGNANSHDALRDRSSVQLDSRSADRRSATGSAPKVAPADQAASSVQGSLLPAALSAPGVADPASPETESTVGAKRQGRRGATMEGSADKPARRRQRREMPEGWAPTAKHAEQAKALGVDLIAEREKFTAWCLAQGQIYVDWDQAFRNWLLNARERQQRRPGAPASPTEEVPAFVRRPTAVPTGGLLAPAPTRPSR